MTDRPLRRIRAVEARPGYRLAVSWEQGGPHMIVDLSHMVQRGGVFTELRDEQKFALVRIGERNRVVEWPTPSDNLGYPIIDIDAESLYVMGAQQKALAGIQKLSSAVKTFEKSSSAI